MPQKNSNFFPPFFWVNEAVDPSHWIKSKNKINLKVTKLLLATRMHNSFRKILTFVLNSFAIGKNIQKLETFTNSSQKKKGGKKKLIRTLWTNNKERIFYLRSGADLARR